MFKIVKNLFFFFFVIPVLETIVIFSRCAWWSKLRVTILKRFYNSAPPPSFLGRRSCFLMETEDLCCRLGVCIGKIALVTNAPWYRTTSFRSFRFQPTRLCCSCFTQGHQARTGAVFQTTTWLSANLVN